MLSRAKERHTVSTSSSVSASQQSKPDLGKELFPSSSPSVRDSHITDYSKKSRFGHPLSASLGSSKAAPQIPLKPRSDNTSRRQPISTSSAADFVKPPTAGFSSLFARTDSFSDDPVSRTAAPGPNTVASVYIGEDDFSDDENLELDYVCPSSFVALPPASLAQASPGLEVAPASTCGPSPATSTIQIPWTSSPLEHLYPPAAKKTPLVRLNAHNVAAGVKKRKLPAGWADSSAKEEREEEQLQAKEHGVRSISSTATPAPKPKNVLWDVTNSETKKRKQLLKNQSKKAEASSGYAMEDTTAVTGSHMKQTTAALSLSSEQQQVLDLVMQKNQSVFFTGPAGTGKSVLMRAIIAEMKRKWARDPERLSVTASTGLAACNIGGMTLHSFSGIGLGKEDVPTLVRKIRRNAKAKNRWLRTRTLIIDEISMVDGELFDKLAEIAKTIRNNGRPWGGIQLVITGDFFQLPPVPDRNKRDTKFAFDAGTWNMSIDHTIGLTQVFRQRDPHFASMLNEMRLGRVSDETVNTFKSLSRPLNFDDGLDATELFPTRQEVERSNEMRLRNLPGEARKFDAIDSGDPLVRDKLLENMMAPKSIELKKGAQVMLIKNLDDTLVNGSLGKVRGFMTEAACELWSGHESGDEGDGGSSSITKIKQFAREGSSVKDLTEYPLVQFTGTDGSHRSMLIMNEDWKVELPNGDVQAQRKQLPLILAWALSIHKAQGQTLERVKVDLGKVFEKGQAYVALSRATNKQGLQVLRFDKAKVMAHPRVIQFYNKLYSAETANRKAPATIMDFAFKGKPSTATKKGVEIINLDEDDEEDLAAYG